MENAGDAKKIIDELREKSEQSMAAADEADIRQFERRESKTAVDAELPRMYKQNAELIRLVGKSQAAVTENPTESEGQQGAAGFDF